MTVRLRCTPVVTASSNAPAMPFMPRPLIAAIISCRCTGTSQQVVAGNHHALARGFVTLDNFYDSGEQSSTGWTWTTAGRAPDLLEKTAPVNYAARGLACEAEEADRFVYTQQTMAERHATNPALSTDPDLMPGPALLTAPDADGDDDDDRGQGFLWDAAVKAGLTVRNYGFSDASVYDTDKSGAVPPLREPWKTRTRIHTPATGCSPVAAIRVSAASTRSCGLLAGARMAARVRADGQGRHAALADAAAAEPRPFWLVRPGARRREYDKSRDG